MRKLPMPLAVRLYPFSTLVKLLLVAICSFPIHIKAHLLRGLTEQGADVIDIGMVSTDHIPTMPVRRSTSRGSWLRRRIIRLNAAVLKWCAICRICQRRFGYWGFASHRGTGRLFRTYPRALREPAKQNLQDGFVDKVLSVVDRASIAPLKVIADTGNGMVGPSLERFEQFCR